VVVHSGNFEEDEYFLGEDVDAAAGRRGKASTIRRGSSAVMMTTTGSFIAGRFQGNFEFLDRDRQETDLGEGVDVAKGQQWSATVRALTKKMREKERTATEGREKVIKDSILVKTENVECKKSVEGLKLKLTNQQRGTAEMNALKQELKTFKVEDESAEKAKVQAEKATKVVQEASNKKQAAAEKQTKAAKSAADKKAAEVEEKSTAKQAQAEVKAAETKEKAEAKKEADVKATHTAAKQKEKKLVLRKQQQKDAPSKIKEQATKINELREKVTSGKSSSLAPPPASSPFASQSPVSNQSGATTDCSANQSSSLWGWGFGDQWKAGAASVPIPVGLFGRSKRAARYRVTRPGCPQRCQEIPVDSVTSAAALEKLSCSVRTPEKQSISAGKTHSCAISELGKMICWGSDAYRRSSGVPKDVAKWSQVVAGPYNTCGITSDGNKLRCWGGSRYQNGLLSGRVSRMDMAIHYLEDYKGQRNPLIVTIMGTGDEMISDKRDVTVAGWKAVSLGSYSMCGITNGVGRGYAHSSGSKAYKDVNGLACCGLELGGSKHFTHIVTVPNPSTLRTDSLVSSTNPEGLRSFSALSVGPNDHGCAIEQPSGELFCWGKNEYLQASGWERPVSCIEPKVRGEDGGRRFSYSDYGKDELKTSVCLGLSLKTRFASVSAGTYHTCAIEHTKRTLYCWGRDNSKQVSGWLQLDGQQTSAAAMAANKAKFESVSAGKAHTCAVKHITRTLICWGSDVIDVLSFAAQGPPRREFYTSGWKEFFPNNTAIRAVSTGSRHTCILKDGSAIPVCWGDNSRNQATVPKADRWSLERSCQIQHPQLRGSSSCTMCAKNCHHTITDPKNNAGTCTKKECPMCKPKSCCGKRHKHYVYNTESMEGVCVRHNDDCSAVCMPRKTDPLKRRICSKGCNKLVKVPKKQTNGTKSATSDKDLFDIVVCQVDHKIVCEALTAKGSPCKTWKAVTPVARCNDFDAMVWSAGATCVANIAHQDKHPQCPSLNDDAKIALKKCKASVTANEQANDMNSCEALGTALAEYY